MVEAGAGGSKPGAGGMVCGSGRLRYAGTNGGGAAGGGAAGRRVHAGAILTPGTTLGNTNPSECERSGAGGGAAGAAPRYE